MKTVSISNDQFRSYFLSFHFVVHFCLLNEDFYMELYCLKNVADSIGAWPGSLRFFCFKSRSEYWICSVAFICLFFFLFFYLSRALSFSVCVSLSLHLSQFFSPLALIDSCNWRHVVTSQLRKFHQWHLYKLPNFLCKNMAWSIWYYLSKFNTLTYFKYFMKIWMMQLTNIILKVWSELSAPISF